MSRHLGPTILPIFSTVLLSLAAAILCPVVPSWCDQYVYGDRPQPLVSHPFPCPSGALDDEGRALLQVRVDTLGFVDATRFVDEAPADSSTLTATARRWIFRPAKPWGTAKPIPVWVALPYRAYCPSRAPRDMRWLVECPDSALLRQVRAPQSVTAWLLLTPSLENLELVRQTPGSRYHFADYWVRATRPDSTGDTAQSLLRVLEDPRSRQGADPIARRCTPEANLGLTFGTPGTKEAAYVWISTACDFMQVQTSTSLLLLPYAPVREQVLALARSLFPEEPAFRE